MSNIVIYLILAILSLCVQIAFILYNYLVDERNKLTIVLKTFASLGFVICAIFAAINVQTNSEAILNFSSLIVLGALLGFFGDIFLGLRHYFYDQHNKFKYTFLTGSVFFFLGHLFYLIAVLQFVDNVFVIIILGVIFMAFVSWRLYKLLDAKLKYEIMGCIYLVVLFSFAFGSLNGLYNALDSNYFGLCLPVLSCFLLCLGSLLFSLADCLTSYKSFGKKEKYIK